MKILMLLLGTAIWCQATFAAEEYQNTSQEFSAFKNFVENYQGTVVCEGLPDYIYGKGITIYLRADLATRNFYLSTFDNSTSSWTRRDIALNYKAGFAEGLATFSGDNSWDELDLGVGTEGRDWVTGWASHKNSAEYPYAGSANYQFHSICKILPIFINLDFTPLKILEY